MINLIAQVLAGAIDLLIESNRPYVDPEVVELERRQKEQEERAEAEQEIKQKANLFSGYSNFVAEKLDEFVEKLVLTESKVPTEEAALVDEAIVLLEKSLDDLKQQIDYSEPARYNPNNQQQQACDIQLRLAKLRRRTEQTLSKALTLKRDVKAISQEFEPLNEKWFSIKDGLRVKDMEGSRDEDIVLPEGLRLRPVEPIKTKLGSVRQWSSLTFLEKSFFIIALLGTAISLGFSVQKIISSSPIGDQADAPSADEDFVLAIVLTVNIGFCFLYIIDGILTEKPYELLIFLAADVIVTVYVIGNYAYRCVQYEQAKPNPNNQTLFAFFADDENGTTTTAMAPTSMETTMVANLTTSWLTTMLPTTTHRPPELVNYCEDPVKISRLVLTSLLSPPAIVMGIYIAKDYIERGEFIFRIVGADAALQTACKIFFAAISIIRLDLMFQLSMVVLILNQDIDHIDLTEILILAIGVPFSVLWALGSYLSLRWENKKLLVVVLATSLIEPAYIFYRMFLAGQDIIAFDDKLLSVVTFLFGAGALLSRALHLALLYFSYRNFNRGLKERIFK